MGSNYAKMKRSAVSVRALRKHNLFLMLFCGLISGILFPVTGQTVGKIYIGEWPLISTLCVAFMFFLTGLRIHLEEIKRAMKAWKLVIYSNINILIFTPVLGFIPLELPFLTKEFRIGLALMCCMPTTLATGIAIVSNSNGNTILALMITVTSNLLGIFTAPFALSILLSTTEGVFISPLPLLLKLLMTILLPMVAGKLLQQVSSSFHPLAFINKFACAYGFQLKILSNFLLVMIPWIKISQASTSLKNTAVTQLLFCLSAAAVLHILILVINCAVLVGGRANVHSPREFRSVLFMASQKTMLLAMSMISFLPEQGIGQVGLVIIPCIILHSLQLFMDAPLASYLGRGDSALHIDQEGDVESPKQHVVPHDISSIKRSSSECTLIAQQEDSVGKEAQAPPQ